VSWTAVFLKQRDGYVGFVEQLPAVSAHARTLSETRDMLVKLLAVVFDEERRRAEELIAGKEVVREPLYLG
jgi:predicted RNase H-like HicB family nuclease